MRAITPFFHAATMSLIVCSTTSFALPLPPEKRALAACLADARRQLKRGNQDRISTSYGMNRQSRTVYDYYLNTAVHGEASLDRERQPMKVYCRATSGKNVLALRFSPGAWSFVANEDASVINERVADAG